jgi:hypothetical protein
MIVSEYTIPGMHLRDHVVTVPLDWSQPEDGRTIEVFAREVVDPKRKNEDLPKLASSPMAKRRPIILPASAPTRSSPMPSTCAKPCSAAGAGSRWGKAMAAS